MGVCALLLTGRHADSRKGEREGGRTNGRPSEREDGRLFDIFCIYTTRSNYRHRPTPPGGIDVVENIILETMWRRQRNDEEI